MKIINIKKNMRKYKRSPEKRGVWNKIIGQLGGVEPKH